jgi:hypothetical protein
MEYILDTFPGDSTSQEALSGIMLLNGKDLLVLYGTLMFQINFIRSYDERAGLVLVHLIQPLG